MQYREFDIRILRRSEIWYLYTWASFLVRHSVVRTKRVWHCCDCLMQQQTRFWIATYLFWLEL